MPASTIAKPFEEDLLKAAADFALELYRRIPDSRLVFHNYELAHQMAATVREIAEADGVDGDTFAIAGLSSWIFPCGYLLDYRAPLQPLLREVKHFFSAHPCPEKWRIGVVQCLQTLYNQQTPASPEEQLLSDAYSVSAFIRPGENRLALLKLEWELVEGRAPEKWEWTALQARRLAALPLFYRYSKLHYQPLLANLLLQVQRSVEKQRANLPETPENTEPFHYLEPDSPVRAAQTFFRANYRNHINLSAIADNKANIMISVNSILISVLITFLSYRNIAEVKPLILLPVILFLVTGLTSLIFAVLAARPKVTALNRGQKDPAIVRRNLIFFGNFVPLQLEEYEAAMDEMFRNSALLYGNMTRDMYHLGKVLDRKYRYLTVSYNLFMLGFAATVITFIIILFM